MSQSGTQKCIAILYYFYNGLFCDFTFPHLQSKKKTRLYDITYHEKALLKSATTTP